MKTYKTKKDYIKVINKTVKDVTYINYLKASSKYAVVEAYQELVHSQAITEQI
jgi:hypothetical protein